MKQVLTFLLLFSLSCTSQSTGEQHGSHAQEQAGSTIAMPANNEDKWKADEATKQNVAALVLLVNDSTHQQADNRKLFAASFQKQIDTLIKQCRMKGPEHDALHVWLEQVLKDLKALNEENREYSKAFATLKMDVESFDMHFN